MSPCQVVHPDSLALSLHRLLSNPEYLDERAHVATSKMNALCFDWMMIQRQWAALFNEAFGS